MIVALLSPLVVNIATGTETVEITIIAKIPPPIAFDLIKKFPIMSIEFFNSPKAFGEF